MCHFIINFNWFFTFILYQTGYNYFYYDILELYRVGLFHSMLTNSLKFFKCIYDYYTISMFSIENKITVESQTL